MSRAGERKEEPMSTEGRRGGELGFPNSRLVDGLDEVARGLAAGTISRRRAIKLSGAALLGGVGVLSLFPHRAGAQVTTQDLCSGKPAISNRKCPQEESFCGTCPGCQCARTLSGKKRCLDFGPEQCPETDECDANRDCPGDEVCVRVAGCCGGPRRNLCAAPCPTVCG